MSISRAAQNCFYGPRTSPQLLSTPLQSHLISIKSHAKKNEKIPILRMPRACQDARNPIPKPSLQISDSLFKPIEGATPSSSADRNTKVTVVGVGNVGMAIAQTILTQDLCNDLALVDINPAKLRGEMLDLQHAAAFLPGTKISASTDYAVTAGSDICVITAGARQHEGESRLALLERNYSLFTSIVPNLVRHSPEAILLVVSNPVDILTYITWKISGFPPNRVVGSGTNLDSSRFRFAIASQLDVNAQDVNAYIVGEHGDSSVALWSTLSVGGATLEKQGIPFDRVELERVHKGVVESAEEVIKLKGYTSWAIGYSAASLVRSMVRNQRRIHAVSVMAKGLYGIEEKVYLSLPSQLGRGGVLGAVNVPLTEDEKRRLRASAGTIFHVQKQLDI